MVFLKTPFLLLPLLAAGCYVVQDEPSEDQPQLSSGETAVQDTSESDEVDYVVYREYFGCSEDEIAYFPHYREYYGLTNDDIYFLYFTSRQCGVTFDVCFHSYYYDCDRNYDRLVLYYHVPRERYFVAIGAGVSLPPMYARTYAAYRGGSTASVTFTNQEYVSLVHMKVGCDYQGNAPAAYFTRVQSSGSSRGAIVEGRDHDGRGGHTVLGAQVTTMTPRPWAMAPQQRQQWHQERQASVVKTEAPFKERHAEQVNKVGKQGAARQESEPRGPERTAPPGQALPPREHPPAPVDPNRRRPEDRVPPPENQPPRRQEPRKPENPPPKQPPPPPHEPVERQRDSEKPRGEERGGQGDRREK